MAQEAPDTLLLAEAFWLMEGYFVRTLGMHRVYNSAFMNMLRDEKNAEYRLVIKNTLEFDPRILERYVNFMNNPDERTAVDQFGKEDKYIGICTLMATMPGLPMFGHGQIEGFTEKYGMEYRRAYRDEQPDRYLVQRHERESFSPAASALPLCPGWGFPVVRFPACGRARQRGCLRLLESRGPGAMRWWSITTAMPRRGAISTPRWPIPRPLEQGEGRQLVRQSLGQGLLAPRRG